MILLQYLIAGVKKLNAWFDPVICLIRQNKKKVLPGGYEDCWRYAGEEVKSIENSLVFFLTIQLFKKIIK